MPKSPMCHYQFGKQYVTECIIEHLSEKRTAAVMVQIVEGKGTEICTSLCKCTVRLTCQCLRCCYPALSV